MTLGSSQVLIVLALLAAAGIALVLVWSRRKADASPESVVLLQQEIARLGQQVALLGAQVPRDVGASLQHLTGQVGQRLAENAGAVQAASAQTGKLIADINVRLGELKSSSQEILTLGQDMRKLQQIFQAPKIRGGLGEIALGSLLQQIFPADQFALQHTFQDGRTVDAILKLPGGLVPIDSKFPLAGFRLLLEATGPEARQRARRQFAREVRKHIDDIADKYCRPAEGTFDFALMYVPAENVFYELIAPEEAGDEDISAYALERRVIPVSPNSIYAYLQAIAYGLMGLRIERQARDILKGLQGLTLDYGSFRDAFDRALKQLRQSQDNFSEADKMAARLGDELRRHATMTAGPPAADLPAPAAAAIEPGLAEAPVRLVTPRLRGLDS